MRLGIFGGSFDPVHNGHLALAENCLQQAELDQVWFVPAATQPFKPQGPAATDADRCTMLMLAIEYEPRFRLSRVELERGGPSYTVETLREIHNDRPEEELFLLMGADAFADLPSWYQSEEICRLATPVVVSRGDVATEIPPGGASQVGSFPGEAIQVRMPTMPESSNEVRRRVQAGVPVANLVPSAVARYIARHDLYREQ